MENLHVNQNQSQLPIVNYGYNNNNNIEQTMRQKCQKNLEKEFEL